MANRIDNGLNAWLVIAGIFIIVVALVVSDFIPMAAVELPVWYPPVIL